MNYMDIDGHKQYSEAVMLIGNFKLLFSIDFCKRPEFLTVSRIL
jgi:hypothetical protein